VIALDTNVLVRYLVMDDVEQAEAARTLLEGLTSQNPGFICREVAIELVWVLGRAYHLTRGQISDVLVELVGSDALVCEAATDVARAALRYGQGGPDFADLMVLFAAERAGATPLHTFDRSLSRLEGAALVGTLSS
jgi:predicted nucleic-acid-binding protein